MNVDKIKCVQRCLGVKEDGIFGPISQAALDLARSNHPVDSIHHGKASSFADPADVEAFRICKLNGGSDRDCFKVGDNGVGYWGDDTSEGSGPSCALPPEDMEEKWGSVSAAKHKLVAVAVHGKTVACTLKDRMPHRDNITNRAIIDLNPDACKLLGLTPPVMVDVAWKWV